MSNLPHGGRFRNHGRRSSNNNSHHDTKHYGSMSFFSSITTTTTNANTNTDTNRIPRKDTWIQNPQEKNRTPIERRMEESHVVGIILDPKDYAPKETRANILQASQWNQGLNHSWNPQFCADAVNQYEQHLRYICHRFQEVKQTNSSNSKLNMDQLQLKNSSNQTIFDQSPKEKDLDISKNHDKTTLEIYFLQQIHPDPNLYTATRELLSSHTVERAFKAILKTKIHTQQLSKRIREWERLIGTLRFTPITHALSLRLLEANGKAGNVGRSLALLHLRKVKGYEPNLLDFEYALRSIESAALFLRCNRNIFLRETDQPDIDNPTRWLDAILMNMSERKFPLTIELANRMLDCYAQTGRSGKAMHYFYKVVQVREEDKADTKQVETPTNDSIKTSNPPIMISNSTSSNMTEESMSIIDRRKARIRIKYNALPPPYHKVISEVKNRGGQVFVPSSLLSSSSSSTSPTVRGTASGGGIVSKGELLNKIEIEKNRDWSPPLTAAFAFFDSLIYGACGHEPITPDLTSWNTMIKVCCYRGALWRALEILNETIPKYGLQPDTYSYNTILSGLARVGDRDFMRDLLTTMTNKGVPVDKYTIQALIDGYLNAGDISGAVTLIQDVFNQHQVLPPYTSHLKIIEFALGNDLLFEAKRQVYFIQQLWKLQPSEKHTEDFRKLIQMTQKNPRLSKEALRKLFAYFGEELKEDDFLL